MSETSTTNAPKLGGPKKKPKLGGPKIRKDGAGSIFKEKGGTWRAQIRYFDKFSNKSLKISRRVRTRDEAREALKELLAHGVVKRPASSDMRIVDYLDKYVAATLPTTGVSANTIAITKTLIANPLKPTLGEIRLEDFDMESAREWLARLQAARTRPHGEGKVSRPLAGSTLHKAFYVLAKVLDIATSDGLISDNPLRKLKPPRIGAQPVPTTSATDFDNLIVPALSNNRLQPLVVLIGLTGCRLGEALGLHWSDVDLTRNTATFRRSGVETDRTKTGKIRTVPLVPDIVTALKQRRKTQRRDQLAIGSGWQNDDDLVFTTFEGRPVNTHNARRDFQKVLRRLNLSTVRPFHSLRHGLATRLLQRGIPMHVVSAILGHSSIKLTVDVYGHVEPVMHADELAEALGRK